MSTPRISVATRQREEQPEYRLAREPDGRSWTVRENLVDILERELLGPAGGPEEILNGPPGVAYLVGRIAPVRLTGGRDDPADADNPDAATDVGDAVDADESRGVPVTAVDESSAGSDEDTATEDQPQQRGLMIPASMGLRFQIPADLDAFTVVASWGVYHSIKEERDGADAPRVRRYQRTPVEIPRTVTVEDGGLTAVPALCGTDALHPCDEALELVDPVHVHRVQPTETGSLEAARREFVEHRHCRYLPPGLVHWAAREFVQHVESVGARSVVQGGRVPDQGVHAAGSGSGGSSSSARRPCSSSTARVAVITPCR